MATTTKDRFAGLRAGVAGEVIRPDDSEYDDARRVFVPVDRRPAAIVRPLTADDVAAVVEYARTGGVELAVRSGGHSAAGHGTSEGGIVLDLVRLKALELDVDARAATAETGLTAGEVTAAAAAHRLAVPFGDAAVVGIGGLTLGGGVGYLVRKHGLTIDSLLEAELVTADGKLLTVDADRHPDLFWAIRGGGGNFGVAVRFRYRLHSVESATGGLIVLPATPEVLAEFAAIAAAAPDELSTIANVLPAPPLPFLPSEHHGRPVVMAMVLHVGSSEEGSRALAPFRALGPIVDLVRPVGYEEMFPTENRPVPLAATRTMFLDTIDTAVAGELLDRLRASTAQMTALQLRVLGGAVGRVPAAATAFAHRRRGAIANVAAIYSNPDDASVHEEWAAGAVAALRQGDDGAYVNFLGDEGEDRVRAAYPGDTWDRLVAVKQRYDPGNLFHLNQNVRAA
jgi:FAD/FMN-containing dehydrogenase